MPAESWQLSFRLGKPDLWMKGFGPGVLVSGLCFGYLA